MIGICEDLRKSVLQAAIQGKLTKQLPEDGNAEDLYRDIQKEKQRLIKEGKIKKEKPLPEIAEDDIPFDIPENWKWVRLGDISSYAQPKKKISPASIRPEMWSLDLEDIEKDSGNVTVVVKASNRKIVGDKVIFNRGQILYSKLRPYLRKILIAPDDGICTSEIVPFDCYCINDVHYLLQVLRSPYVDTIVNAVSYGVKMPRVGTDTMTNLLIPLPPLAEQKRIVTRVDELMKRIDEMEKTEKDITALYEAFPGEMKAALLQAAIQGKLTEQLASDGDAETLYADIQKEKQRLIKEGKIKKEKPLPEIAEDDIPFDIPENWKWVRLEDIGLAFADGPFGSNLKKEHYTNNPEVRIIQLSNIGEDGWKDANVKFTTYKHLGTIQRSEVEAGNIVIAKMMPAGRAIIVPDLGTKFVLSSDAVKVVPSKCIEVRYLLYAINSNVFKSQIYEEVQGITRVRTSLTKLKGYLLPLPPLAEQKRIVDKLDQLLPLCDAIRKNISGGEIV